MDLRQLRGWGLLPSISMYDQCTDRTVWAMQGLLMWSFANVVRPTASLEGSVVGDSVPANTVNSLARKVSVDWKVNLMRRVWA